MITRSIGIGFGTWAWGNKLVWGYESVKDNILLKKTFFEALNGGLDLIDTADSYGTGNLSGQSEKLIGSFLNEASNEKLKNITIATKLAPFPWRIGRNGFKKAFHESNKRLKGHTTRVQLHWSTYRYAPWQEIQLLNGLADLYENGCIKEIGLSNTGPKRLIFLYEMLNSRGIKIKSIQIQFSLLTKPSAEEESIKNICKEFNIEFLAYSPLALGVLSVPHNKSPKPSTILRQKLFNKTLPETNELRKLLKDIGKKHGATQAQTALNWIRSHGAKPIVGIRTPTQAKDACAALKWSVTKNEKEDLDMLRNKCKVYMPKNPLNSP